MPFANPLHDPAKRIIRFPTVQFQNSWPKAPSQYVFIYEALNLVGPALFGADWTGHELTAVTWPESPTAQRRLARLVRPAPPVPHSLSQLHKRKPEKPEPIEHLKDWQAEKLNESWEMNARAAERLWKCVDWIAQKCRDEELTAFWRLRVGGGPLRAMNAYEWNVDIPMLTFVSVGGNNRYCRELKGAGPFDTFVFFEKVQLLTVLNRQPDTPLIVGEADLSRLSPYLQMAVRLALRHGYTSREACDATPVREAEVKSAWPELLPDVPLSGKALEAIAKVIGFPDIKAIAAGQRAATRKAGGTAKV